MAKKTGRSDRCAPPDKTGSLFRNGAQQVRTLIAENHSKAAVEIAKDLHKRYATTESETLLVEAYEARIRNLLNQGMSVEAKSLLQLVSTRFPGARNRLEEIEWEVRAGAGNVAEMVAPLLDPNLAAEVRERIETMIRQRVDDLSALAQATSLPPTHPLREAAAALSKAFQAVTSGEVDDEALRLPQVSRHSPLASWKALIQAIAGFYRGEEDRSRKWLEAIAPDSAPARLIEPMRALLGISHAPVASPAAMNLVRAVGSSQRVMQAALASLEETLLSGNKQRILEQGRDAISLCRQCRPELVEKLRQHILARSMLVKIKAERVFAAVGKAKEDAYWLRLLARGIEQASNDCYERRQALHCWEDFRRHAIREGWFAANSLQDGLLSLRMARTVIRFPPDVIEEWLEDDFVEFGLPGVDGMLPASSLLDAGILFARACRGDPHPEVFEEWLAWAQQQQDHHAADEVAELWRQTRTQDVAPLLWLVESAERRGAYQKSLKYLEQAEQLDQLNPEVRRVRLRLLVAGVLRHFRQRKPHLAAQGIDRMAALPEALEGKLGPAIAALRRVCAALRGDAAGTAAYQLELEVELGDSAFALLKGVADGAGLTLTEAGLPPATSVSFAGSGALARLAKTCVVGDLLGIRAAIPETWEAGISAALSNPADALDAAQLLVIGEAALRGQTPKLAYQVSAAGMSARAADSRFLFLRGRALPGWASERSFYCLLAALALARRDREMELGGRVLDQLRGHPAAPLGSDEPGSDGFSIQPELLQKVVEEERTSNTYPDPGRRKTPAYLPQRMVETRKAGRRRPPFYLDEEEEDAFEEFEDMVKNAPPEVRRQALEALERGESTAEILVRILLAHVAPGAPYGAHAKKPPKLPPPGQGSLF
jgi:tetratricopeptide (TPR) repeat protein